MPILQYSDILKFFTVENVNAVKRLDLGRGAVADCNPTLIGLDLGRGGQL